MADHDVPEDPGCAAVLEDHVIWAERVVEIGDLFVLNDGRVSVYEASGDSGCAACVEDVEGVGVGYAGELEG